MELGAETGGHYGTGYLQRNIVQHRRGALQFSDFAIQVGQRGFQ
jgi:hypothetical protein